MVSTDEKRVLRGVAVRNWETNFRCRLLTNQHVRTAGRAPLRVSHRGHRVL